MSSMENSTLVSLPCSENNVESLSTNGIPDVPSSDNMASSSSNRIPADLIDVPIQVDGISDLANFDMDELLKMGELSQFGSVQEPPVLHIPDIPQTQKPTVLTDGSSKQASKRVQKRRVTIEHSNNAAASSSSSSSSKKKKECKVLKKTSSSSSGSSAGSSASNSIESIPLASLLPLQMYSEMLGEIKRTNANAKITMEKCDQIDNGLDEEMLKVQQINEQIALKQSEISKLRNQGDGIKSRVLKERQYNGGLRKQAEVDIRKAAQLQETVAAVYERWRQELDAAFQINVD